jgi:hypothetical protein
MKRLRFDQDQKKQGTKIRFVASAEYGEGEGSRPHYHAILYNLDLEDLEHHHSNEQGQPLFTSEYLTDVWGKGFVTIGEVTPQSCRYVASYMLKDTTGNYIKKDKDGNKVPYTILDLTTGEHVEREYPSARFSSKPGIGHDWIHKYYTDVFPSDEIVDLVYNQEGGYRAAKLPVPRYYLDQLKKIDPKMYEKVIQKRRDLIASEKAMQEDNPERRSSKRRVRTAQMQLKNRASNQNDATVDLVINSETDPTHKQILEHYREVARKVLEHRK